MVTMPAANVDDLVRRLACLAALAKKAEKKGEERRFHLGKKISPASLSKWEREQRVKLPDEYRAFLLAAGEGAAGPVYGMLSLAAAMKERGEGIYDLADPFPAPLSTKDHLDFNVGGILPISYDGCAYFHGLVVSGPARGQVWFSLEDRPGWVPCTHGQLVDEDNVKYTQRGDEYGRTYDLLLHKRNEKRRIGFANWYAGWLADEEKALGEALS
jgi:hypothetical protein